MAAFVATDNELIVDKVITESREKKTQEMEGFGRDLVPYFVPGATELDEGAVNVNTDIDSHRRAGGSVLGIPMPSTAVIKAGNASKAQGKKSSRSKKAAADGKQKPAATKSPGATKSPSRATSKPLARVDATTVVEAWAGPTFVSSPPPSSLPVPSRLLLGLPSAEARRALSFHPEGPTAVAVSSNFPFSSASVQADLKRLLKVS